MIELRDVVVELRPRRRRDQRCHPLDGLSVEVADGEVVALVGRAGFGGTTITRLVAGVLSPHSGDIVIDSLKITDMPAKKRSVGLIPAGGGLLPHLTARDNITYGLRLRGRPTKDVRSSLEKAAERLELAPSLPLLPHELSAGQRMRVAFARAVVKSVRVLAVDATAGSEGMAQLRKIIDVAQTELAQPDTPMSMLLCTHDRAVFSQADRVVVIEGGRTRTEASGPPEQLMAEPPDLPTARILHPQPMPEILGVVGDGYIDCGAFRLPAPAEIRQGRRVLVALTADAVDTLVADGDRLPAKIVAVERTGVSVHVRIEVPVEVSVEVSVERPGRRGVLGPVRWTLPSRPRLGERVGIRFAAERILVFDAEVEGCPRLAPRVSG